MSHFFGEWRLGKEIESLGRGQSSYVFTIHSGSRVAALKVISIPMDDAALCRLRHELQSEDRVKAQLQRDYNYARSEIRTMDQLNGTSNIVYFENSAIYERSDIYGWDVLIRMERLIPFGRYLKDLGNKRTTALILRIWDELLEGLKACQSLGIVHLDIKPQNIFYASGTDYFKLGNFSEAKQSRNGELVAVNSKFGTRGYIAPEINAMRGGDGRADLYSLALVIYSLFNRDCLPFVQHGAEALNEEIERADQMRLSGCEIPRIKGLDPEIMDVLLRCLEMDPERRYRSAADAQMAVRRILYSGGKRGCGVRHVLPLLIALTSLGIAGVLVLFGMSAMRGGKSSQTAAQVAAIDGVESTLEAGIDDALPDDISIQLPYQDARGSVPWADWIGLSIDAESGAEVELIIEQDGSAIAKDTFVGADAAVQRQYALEGGSYTVSARYVDAPEINTAVQIAVDGAKKLVELDAPVYAGSQTISGTTAAKSTVAIYDDRDKRLFAGTADDQGRFELEEVSLEEGRSYRIQVDVGGVCCGSLEFAPEKVELAPLTLMVDRLVGSELAFTWNGGVQVKISGEPGAKVKCELKQKGAVTASAEAMLDADGNATVNLQAADGAYTLHAWYADQEFDPAEISLTVDSSVPPIALDSAVYAGAHVLTGTAVPNSVINAYASDASGNRQYASVQVDADGRFSLPKYSYELGGSYRLIGTSADGSYGPVELQVEAKPGISMEGEPASGKLSLEQPTIRLTGTAAADAMIALYLDRTQVGEVQADAQGSWVYEMTVQGMAEGETRRVLVAYEDNSGWSNPIEISWTGPSN